MQNASSKRVFSIFSLTFNNGSQQSSENPGLKVTQITIKCFLLCCVESLSDWDFNGPRWCSFKTSSELMSFRTEIEPLNSNKQTGNVHHVCHQLSCTSADNKRAGLLSKGPLIQPIPPKSSPGCEMRNRSEGEQELIHLLIS